MSSVLNVGAGAGSYEPPATVVAVEPSQVMIAQRPVGAAPCVRARAEALPLREGCVEAAMAVLTVHHWADLAAGIAQLRRVARRRIVILTWDPALTAEYWLLREYVPRAAAIDQARAVPLERLADLLGGARIEPVPVPFDCTDGFAAAYWRRPHAYLDPDVRAGISVLAQVGEPALADGLARLAADLASGRWHDQHADLLDLDWLDTGYRMIITDLGGG
nr:methyltransferase domain-containing protein [Candidatus Frankia nodulisporulans]